MGFRVFTIFHYMAIFVTPIKHITLNKSEQFFVSLELFLKIFDFSPKKITFADWICFKPYAQKVINKVYHSTFMDMIQDQDILSILISVILIEWYKNWALITLDNNFFFSLCFSLTSSNNQFSEFRISNIYKQIFVLIFLMILRRNFEASLRFRKN